MGKGELIWFWWQKQLFKMRNSTLYKAQAHLVHNVLYVSVFISTFLQFVHIHLMQTYILACKYVSIYVYMHEFIHAHTYIYINSYIHTHNRAFMSTNTRNLNYLNGSWNGSWRSLPGGQLELAIQIKSLALACGAIIVVATIRVYVNSCWSYEGY
jgi:hypothetical protein